MYLCKNFQFKMSITKFFLFIFLIFIFASCGENFIFEKKKDINNQQWTYQDSINFDFEIKDTFKIYNLCLEIEHPDNYPYQNIYLMTHTKFPTGERPSQRINVDLAKNTGEWLGEKNGNKYTHRIDLQPNAYFNNAGNYTLTLGQYMRQDSLPLSSVRFFIEDTKKTRNEIEVKTGNRPAPQKEKYKVR